MTNFSCIRRLCLALSLLLLIAVCGPASGLELTDVQSDPYADTPLLLLEFSSEPTWTEAVALRGDKTELRLEFAGATNAKTQDGYHREFRDTPGFIESLDINTVTGEDGPSLVVRLMFPRASDATVALGGVANTLVVTLAPAVAGALPPIIVTRADSPSPSAGAFYVVGGLILVLGAGGVAIYFVMQGRDGGRPTTVAVPVEEAKAIMREDAEAYREAADAALDGSHERHQRLVRIVRQDMSEMRLEMRSLAGEFERATQSVLLFGEPFVPQPDDAPTELGLPASPQVVARAGSMAAGIEASSESVSPLGSETASGVDSPYARARRMVQDGADLSEIGRITGLSSAELDLLARLGRMKSSSAAQASHAE